MRNLFFALLVLPLSACFDMEMVVTFHDDETATMETNVTVSPELADMAGASDEDICKGSVEHKNEDGTLSCVNKETLPIDTLIATINEVTTVQGKSVNPSLGIHIERLDGAKVKLVLNVAEIRREATEQGIEPAMLGVLQHAFQGHGIQITVKGQEIIDTNATLATMDGKSARIDVPLIALFQSDSSLPDMFFVIVRTE
jgi:hypothetical protein